jgi:hypothetical protein
MFEIRRPSVDIIVRVKILFKKCLILKEKHVYGCNCKNENGSIEDLLNNNEPSKKLNIVQTIIKYSLKNIRVLIMLVFLPILI